MKNNIKKIIVGILSFVVLFSSQNVFAGNIWNQASNDCADINIANYTTNVGYGNPCWTGTNINANPGDTINIRVYYHNTSNTVATNTYIKVVAPSGSKTSHSFTAQIISPQGSLFSSPVTVNIPSSQTLTFGSTRWYPNQSQTSAGFLNNQDGSEVIDSGGLYIGNINPGWNSQGSVVVSFKVSSVTPPQLCQDPNALNYHGPLPCVYPPTPTCTISNFSANPTSITTGGSSTLSWNTSSCASVNISPNVGTFGPSGTFTVYPSVTKTYTLKAYSERGILSDTKSVTIFVNNPPVDTCEINNFTASDTYIEYGDSTLLNWNTSDCTSVSISSIGNVNTSGSQTIWPSYTKTYTLTAYGINGITQSRSVTVYVDENNDNDDECYINDFSASDTSIDEGDSTTLRWSTTDCDHVTISKIGSVDDDGSERVYPRSDTTYTLTAYNSNGNTETESVRIYVDEDDNNNDDECYINSFTTNKIYINRGDSVTLRWSTTDCDDIDISGVDNNLDDDGSETIYPTSTRTYTLRASGDEGDDSRSITINVNNYYNPVTPIYNTNVVTTVATNISQTGAQVNGLITSSNYTNENVYFEYGTTVNMGSRTASRTTNGNTNFSEYLTNLSPNTIYYFQALSDGQNGVSRGAIQVFKTLGYVNPVTPTKPIVTQGTTIVASASPIMLRIENKYQTIGIGDIIDYTVYYKNISKSKLTDPMVQVFIPEGITLINISNGTYSESDRTLSVTIADLNPNDEGAIYLQGRVDSLDINLAQVVTTAVLIYTNPNGAQENAMAYVLNNPKVANLLGASAFSGGVFGMNLIEWLFLIIMILVLALIARSLISRRSGTVIHNH